MIRRHTLASNRNKRSGRRAGSFRLCLGCRQRLPRTRMLRLVATKDGVLLPDPNGRLPGRGAHLCPDLRCMVQAERSQALTRTLRATAGLSDPVRMVLTCAAAYHHHALELLERSARIGAMTLSDERTHAALRSGAVALLVLAADAPNQAIHGYTEETGRRPLPIYRDFSGAELSQIAGGQPLCGAGVLHRGIARRLNDQLYKTSRLLDSVRLQNNQSQRHLTAREVFDMMPQEISGQWAGR